MLQDTVGSFEMIFEDIVGLISCAGKYGCSYGSVVNVGGHLWQAGIKGYCGEKYDEVGLYVKYSHLNTTYCDTKVTISVSEYKKVTCPKTNFYPGQESFVLLCKFASVPQYLRVIVQFDTLNNNLHPEAVIPEQYNQLDTLAAFLQSDCSFHDCQLIVNTKVFRAHTCVVAAHSPMLMSLLVETDTVQIEKGFSAEVFHLFLAFMYTGVIPPAELEVYLCPLLDLAGIYRVHSLLQYLTSQLNEFLSEGLIVCVMNVANKHHLNEVGVLARQYYVTHCKNKKM